MTNSELEQRVNANDQRSKSNEEKINALFVKLDSLSTKFTEHDKWAAGHSAKVENDMTHALKELAECREEQRLQQNQMHVTEESSNEERYKLKEHMTSEISQSKQSAIKEANSYTNRGVSIAVGVIVLIYGAIETIYYIHELTHYGGH